MIILPEDFTIEDYGFKARLINEEDASFIVQLRSDKKRTKYMVTLEDDIDKQKKWIREYKIRERKGEDYYFLYSNAADNPISVARISKIDKVKKEGKVSGWIKKKGPRSEAVAIFMLHRKIAFEVLFLSRFYSEVHKDNRASLSFFKEFNETYNFSEKGDFLYLSTFPEDHAKANKIFNQKYDSKLRGGENTL